MSTTATIFGSFPRPAAVSVESAARADVAPVFESYARDAAPVAEPLSTAAATASGSIFDSYSDLSLAAPETVPGPVATALSGWLARIRRAIDRWTESNAQSRADARLWDIARSDPRIMAELMQARQRDEEVTAPVAVTAVEVAPMVAAEAVAPTLRKPRQASMAAGWGRIMEDAYQNRFRQGHPQHA